MFYTGFVSYLENQFGLKDLSNHLSSKTVASDVIELPQFILDTVQSFVSATFKLRNQQSYQHHVGTISPNVAQKDPKNFSALMSYDFHIDEHGQPRLVEINTNAAFSLILWSQFQFHGASALSKFDDEIIGTFRNEFRLNQGGDLKRVLIVDEHPETQRLQVEFILYRSLFVKHGIQAEIQDSTSIDPSPNTLVYNRDTDFYFESPRLKLLHDKYLAQIACVTPNPHEYSLLADKDRMQNFSDSAFLKSHGLDDNEAKTISSVTLKTENVKKYDVDQLWTDRKKLFFKPRRSFGAKAVYRGNSISKGMFQKIYNDDYLAQEFVPPGEITLARGMGHKNFKYDLRFYVYQNKIQLVGARLFLGQVTNFQEDDGGFAPVIFV